MTYQRYQIEILIELLFTAFVQDFSLSKKNKKLFIAS